MRRRHSDQISTGAALLALALVAVEAGAQATRGEGEPPRSEAQPSSKPKAGSIPKVPAAKPKAETLGPVVMSAEAMDKARGKSTGKERYDGEVDWSQVPPWRQSTFFGIKAQGQLFIYVVDCSGSMGDEDRLDRAKAELRRSVNALQSPQRFKVIFYNDQPVPMPGELPKAADYPSKALLSKWLSLVEPEGPTDPRSSLALALAMRPDAVFLLSDGAFPDGTVESAARSNPKKVPIHCVDLANGAAGDGLRKIAEQSGGQYAARGR